MRSRLDPEASSAAISIHLLPRSPLSSVRVHLFVTYLRLRAPRCVNPHGAASQSPSTATVPVLTRAERA
eukprot:858139-Pleurochrysis_carterae.AAC.1